MENEIKEKLYISEKDYMVGHTNEKYDDYILELDGEYKPGVKDDEMLVVPKFTNLHITLYKTQLCDLKLTIQDSFGKVSEVERSDELCSYLFNVKLSTPGPFKFTLSNEDRNLSEFYIIVEPKAFINDRQVHLDGIQIQTVLSKSLGKINHWDLHYKECEYLSKLFR
jgi:hypothetical protein